MLGSHSLVVRLFRRPDTEHPRPLIWLKNSGLNPIKEMQSLVWAEKRSRKRSANALLKMPVLMVRISIVQETVQLRDCLMGRGTA